MHTHIVRWFDVHSPIPSDISTSDQVTKKVTTFPPNSMQKKVVGIFDLHTICGFRFMIIWCFFSFFLFLWMRPHAFREMWIRKIHSENYRQRECVLLLRLLVCFVHEPAFFLQSNNGWIQTKFYRTTKMNRLVYFAGPFLWLMSYCRFLFPYYIRLVFPNSHFILSFTIFYLLILTDRQLNGSWFYLCSGLHLSVCMFTDWWPSYMHKLQ